MYCLGKVRQTGQVHGTMQETEEQKLRNLSEMPGAWAQEDAALHGDSPHRPAPCPRIQLALPQHSRPESSGLGRHLATTPVHPTVTPPLALAEKDHTLFPALLLPPLVWASPPPLSLGPQPPA